MSSVLKVVVWVAVATALMLASAEAASKKRRAVYRGPLVAAQPYPNAVYSYDGTLLGADPDSFIRLMLVREGNPRDQSGR